MKNLASYQIEISNISFCLAPLIKVHANCRASDFFKVGGPKWPMERKMVGHFLK